MEIIDTRLDMLRTLPKGGVVAELGVFVGDFADSIISECNPSRLHLIDKWEGIVKCRNEEGIRRRVNLSEEYPRIAKKYSMIAEVIMNKGSTTDVMGTFQDAYFNWVYIDAGHSYAAVASDIITSTRTVKPGGFICGHDYSPRFPGVVRAVDEAVNAGLVFVALTRDKLPSYKLWIKP
jgi:hypothetical protein